MDPDAALRQLKFLEQDLRSEMDSLKFEKESLENSIEEQLALGNENEARILAEHIATLDIGIDTLNQYYTSIRLTEINYGVALKINKVMKKIVEANKALQIAG
ncbi:MAG: hypothetical protein N3F06_03055, partial [Nitrososphaerales archaeon]|nr:hypothetical protein [Nitrososphaerales archaeon]